MNYVKKGLLISIVFIVLCGGIYPLIVTGIGQVIFPHQANGSIVEVDGKRVGSEHIGQIYNSDKYFQGRLSSAVNYNISETKEAVIASSGSANLGPVSEEIKKRVTKDMEEFIKKNPTVKKEDIASELLAQSASGLDPHITPKGALIQVDRISKETGIGVEKLNNLIEENTEGKFLGLYGGERVNVLNLNMEIDEVLKNK